MALDRKPSPRQTRVQSLVIEEVGKLLKREVELPPDILVTIKGAKISPDLHYATLIVSVLPEHKTPSTLERLSKAAPHLQKILNKNLTMKYVPMIRFAQDRSEERVTRISEVLKEEEK
ncbi:30S ribosome-binding factor RbfA [Patescibacteria group bacterium]